MDSQTHSGRPTRSHVFWKGFLPAVLTLFTGLLVPQKLLIATFRELPADPVLAGKLLLGASLFKAGLIVIGLVIIALNSSRVREALKWSRDPVKQNQRPPEVRPETHRQNSAAGTAGTDPYIPFLLALLILSFALRLYKLGEGLWLDEIGMYLKYLERPIGELLTTYDSENQHFLYTTLAHLCTTLFGERAWGMRFPAVLFGVGSIAALYFVGREVTSKREAFLAAVLLSLSYYHIWFSQNARGYTGLLFWTLFSSWFFLRALSGGPSRLWIHYAVTIALGAFTQLTMIFIVAGHFLIYVHRAFIKGETAIRWTGLVLGFVLGGILTFQLYALVLPQFFTTIGMKGTVAIWNSPFWTLAEIIRGMKVSFAGGFAGIVALFIFAAGFWSYSRTRPLLLALLILPPLLGSMVVIALHHPLWPRFFFFAFGFGSLVVIRGAMVLGRRLAVRHAEQTGTILCCIIILISALSIPHAYLPKQDFEGAAAFIHHEKQPGDRIVTVGRLSAPYKNFYRTDFTEIKSIQDLEEVRLNANRTWLLFMIPEDVKVVYPEVMASIERDFRMVKKFPSPLADGAIFVCVSP